MPLEQGIRRFQRAFDPALAVRPGFSAHEELRVGDRLQHLDRRRMAVDPARPDVHGAAERVGGPVLQHRADGLRYALQIEWLVQPLDLGVQRLRAGVILVKQRQALTARLAARRKTPPIGDTVPVEGRDQDAVAAPGGPRAPAEVADLTDRAIGQRVARADPLLAPPLRLVQQRGLAERPTARRSTTNG